VSGSVPLGKSCVGLVLVGSAVYSHFSPKGHGSQVTGHGLRAHQSGKVSAPKVQIASSGQTRTAADNELINDRLSIFILLRELCVFVFRGRFMIGCQK